MTDDVLERLGHRRKVSLSVASFLIEVCASRQSKDQPIDFGKDADRI